MTWGLKYVTHPLGERSNAHRSSMKALSGCRLPAVSPSFDAVPLSATELVQVRSLSQAEAHGEELIAHCVRTLRLPESEVISRSAIDANTYVTELEVYGSRELTEVLSVSRQRLAQLRAEGTLPEPDALLAATPVWRRRTIDSFTLGWRRRPGPAPADIGSDIDVDQLFSGG